MKVGDYVKIYPNSTVRYNGIYNAIYKLDSFLTDEFIIIVDIYNNNQYAVCTKDFFPITKEVARILYGT